MPPPSPEQETQKLLRSEIDGGLLQAGQRPRSATAPSGGLALIVVDSPRDGLPYQRSLRALGYRTTVRVGGREALTAVQQVRPAVLVLSAWRCSLDSLAFLKVVDVEGIDAADHIVVVADVPAGAPFVLDLEARGVRVVAPPADELVLGTVIPDANAAPPEGDEWDEETDTLGLDELRGLRPPPERFEPRLEVEVGTCLAERFVVEDELGRGAMAAVFRVRDLELFDTVALKLLAPRRSTGDDELRFRQEMLICRRLSHPNLVQVFDFGVWGARPFYTMELLHGRTVRELLDQGGRAPLPARQLIDIGLQAARGLAAAHAKNVHHRDIKSENLFLCDDGTAKLMDFGVARANDLALADSRPGVLLGTPAYLAPERLDDDDVDLALADLYSLGVALYEMATGRVPFQGRRIIHVLDAIATEPPRPPREHNLDLPPVIERLILELLAKDPLLRPASAEELVTRLEALFDRFGRAA